MGRGGGSYLFYRHSVGGGLRERRPCLLHRQNLTPLSLGNSSLSSRQERMHAAVCATDGRALCTRACLGPQ